MAWDDERVFVLLLFPCILLLPGIGKILVLVLQHVLFELSPCNNLYKNPGIDIRKFLLVLPFSFYKIELSVDQRWKSLTERTIR